MKKTSVTPLVGKIAFDYKVQIAAASACFESVMNERPAGGDSTQGVGGTPINMGWTKPQTAV